MEIAGVVTESRSKELAVGARVVSTLASGGGYATSAIIMPFTSYVIPDDMPFDDAAAMTVTYQTAWFALHRRAQMKEGETLLVHAGAGGVGSAAIQLGKAAGAKVIATAGGEKKVEACRALGADLAIDYTKDDFVAQTKSFTQGRGADVIYDPVGGDVFDRSTKCIAWEGRIVIIGFTGGRFADARTNHVLVKNYSVVGLHWGMYNLVDPPAVLAAQAEIYRLYEAKKLKPLVSERVPLREAPAAMNRVASRGTIGKVVLIP
jgi:NADPH2:quinone reductase